MMITKYYSEDQIKRCDELAWSYANHRYKNDMDDNLYTSWHSWAFEEYMKKSKPIVADNQEILVPLRPEQIDFLLSANSSFDEISKTKASHKLAIDNSNSFIASMLRAIKYGGKNENRRS